MLLSARCAPPAGACAERAAAPPVRVPRPPARPPARRPLLRGCECGCGGALAPGSRSVLPGRLARCRLGLRALPRVPQACVGACLPARAAGAVPAASRRSGTWWRAPSRVRRACGNCARAGGAPPPPPGGGRAPLACMEFAPHGTFGYQCAANKQQTDTWRMYGTGIFAGARFCQTLFPDTMDTYKPNVCAQNHY